jgi:hypothetical protein
LASGYVAAGPALASGLQRNAALPGGLDSRLGALTGGGDARYVDDPSSLQTPDAGSDGNAILGHILGNKQTSRAVASQGAVAAGMPGAGLLGMLRPILDRDRDGSMVDDVLGQVGKILGGR